LSTPGFAADNNATRTALAAELRIDEPQLRVTAADARTALNAVIGQPPIEARARLRFGPGRTCEPIARLLDRVIVQAERAGLSPARLIIASGRAEPAEDIVRVRRKAHGKADWIASPTAQVHITLRPVGLMATSTATQPTPSQPTPPTELVASPALSQRARPTELVASPAPGQPAPPAGLAADAPAPAAVLAPAPPGSRDERGGAVREALFDVIDPDLGVNIVDLGFIRGLEVSGSTADITMTLTSAACPLTSIMEDQIRTRLALLDGIDDFRVTWVWLPAWRPTDITDSGRDQLSAIGFTF
jgi:metal-sulfur cluster biosynthetic enzyme/ribosomal protein L22